MQNSSRGSLWPSCHKPESPKDAMAKTGNNRVAGGPSPTPATRPSSPTFLPDPTKGKEHSRDGVRRAVLEQGAATRRSHSAHACKSLADPCRLWKVRPCEVLSNWADIARYEKAPAKQGLKCPGHRLAALLVSGATNANVLVPFDATSQPTGTFVPSFRPLFLPALVTTPRPCYPCPTPMQPAPFQGPFYLFLI